ncbi:MAG: hypothetical protein UX21_C0035G0004 [Microgenomates group bacterium GW2011_GWC2_45_8]|nr:MAG: hypothetical protein UX21_C0035G0004 [Microgenomates group bacterium GW2011_GWC2_45_8]KKU25761.1 MAG: hypothetical protein UX37_C0013G0006 [Microgenomates group bacterium GW2011_GWA2_46_16]
MTSTVTCPSCGHQFSPDDLLTHEIEVELRAKLESELLLKAKEQAGKEIADRDAQIKELKLQAKESADFELKLRAEKRSIEEAREKFELDKTRQLDQERSKIRAEAEKNILDKEKYKIDEYEKKLHDMQKAVEEAQRKGSQSSQQLQGEVQELDLEHTLRELYPYDEITEVKKGENGADIRQTVRTEKGTVCGKILWESKRTKAWSDGWIAKLKEDMRRDSAQLSALVTQIMPPHIPHDIGNINGVWVLTPSAIAPLSSLLRKNLIDVERVKVVAVHKQTTAETLYDYVTSSIFTQNVERIVGVYLDMKAQIAKEQANSERAYKQRSTQVDMLLSGMTGIYGEMQGIAGTSLPPLALLEDNLK